MAETLGNGRIRFINDKFKTSELVVLSSHMRSLLGDKRIILQGGISRAYECAKQLDETIETLGRKL